MARGARSFLNNALINHDQTQLTNMSIMLLMKYYMLARIISAVTNVAAATDIYDSSNGKFSILPGSFEFRVRMVEY